MDKDPLPPVAKGWHRGTIANVEVLTERTEYGNRLTYDFDVRKNDGTKCQIRMTGYTFSSDIRAGMPVEIFVGDQIPASRLEVDRIRLCWRHPITGRFDDLIAFQPVQQAANRTRLRLAVTVLAIGAPVLAFGIAIWLLGSVQR